MTLIQIFFPCQWPMAYIKLFLTLNVHAPHTIQNVIEIVENTLTIVIVELGPNTNVQNILNHINTYTEVSITGFPYHPLKAVILEHYTVANPAPSLHEIEVTRPPKAKKYDSISPTTKLLKECCVAFLDEIQFKYRNITNVDKELNNQLLTQIGLIIRDRLKSIIKNESVKIPCQLRAKYRKKYSLASDMQFLQEEIKKMAIKLNVAVPGHSAKELLGDYENELVLEHSNESLKANFLSHSLRLSKRIKEHLSKRRNSAVGLSKMPDLNDALQKVEPYMEDIVNYVLIETLPKAEEHIKIYFEPDFPKKELLNKFTGQYKAKIVNKAYNTLLVSVAVNPPFFNRLLKMDGKKIGNSTLVVRAYRHKLFKLPDSVYDDSI